MNRTTKGIRQTVSMAGAVMLAMGSGVVFAAGVGTMPFNGDGSGSGFTIDGAGFDANNVVNAPCPTGATCTNMTATDVDGNMLMREVDVNGDRYIQMIIYDPNPIEGNFVSESAVSTQSINNNHGVKIIIDLEDPVNGNFYTEQTMYRGPLFGSVATNNTIAVEVHQDLDDGFQTFDMQTFQAPNQGLSLLRRGEVRIVQEGLSNGRSGDFLHVVREGAEFVFLPGTLTIDGVGSINYAAGDRISATWIGAFMNSGGPNDIPLADGQTQNHDTRTDDQADFGLLIYRARGGTGGGNAGGDPTINDPLWSQAAPDAEVRGFALPLDQGTGEMYNLDHGSFIGGSDILADNWNAGAFGPNPFE